MRIIFQDIYTHNDANFEFLFGALFSLVLHFWTRLWSVFLVRSLVSGRYSLFVALSLVSIPCS